MIKTTIAALLCGLAWLLVGCGARPGIPIERARLGEHEVVLPGRVDHLGIEPNAAYRLRAAVPLPASMHGEPVDLSIPLLEAPVAVFADGQPVPPAGPPPRYREPGPHRFRIPATATADGHLELWLDVHHGWAKSGWLPTVPQLVPAGASDPPAVAAQWLNIYASWLALGVLFQVGTTCVVVYVLDRRRRPYLWFGIQAVLAMPYPAFWSGLLTRWLGPVELPLLDLGVLAGLLVSLRFTHSLFELGRVPRLLDAIVVATAVASAVLLDPFTGATLAARAVAVSVAACATYQVVTIGRVLLRRPQDRAEALLLGSGWIALGIGASGETYSWFLAAELLGGPHLTSVALTVLALFLSLVLSRSHITTLARADELNATLARRVREVETERARATELNEELRAQISERSANLFAALALVDSAGESRRAPLAVGTEIDGRYRIAAALGAGAMGMVYEVVHLTDGSRWAMKVAHEVRGAALARLAREAHLASKLRHENVVQIRDIGASTLGFMYIVLELVEGQSLGQRLREAGPLPPDDALQVLRQVAAGLGALHGAGIAHRDLKPDNVLITAHAGRLVAKITDFGISRLDRRSDPADAPAVSLPELVEAPLGGRERADSVVHTVRLEPEPAASAAEHEDTHAMAPTPAGADPETLPLRPAHEATPQPGAPAHSLALTGTGLLIGTPHYIAPELARPGRKVDVRADLFSFGVLAFELLLGERPFPEAVALRVLRRESVEQLAAPRLPARYDAIEPLLRRCLAFDPASRPTAAEVVAGLATPPAGPSASAAPARSSW